MTEWLTTQGGLVGLGVALAKYGLILYSMISLAIIIERVWVLRRLQRVEAADFPVLRDALAKRRLDELRIPLMSSGAPCVAILRAGLDNQRDGESRLREVINLETSEQIVGLQSNLPMLATAATTAPYIGLFGTVLGILSAFRDIAQTGQNGASVVASGISEALIVTALGLGVAIPAAMAYNYFTSRVNKFSLQIETHALELATRLAACERIEMTNGRMLEVSDAP